MSRCLIGKRYAFVGDSEVLGGDDGDERVGVEEVWGWLKREMCV